MLMVLAALLLTCGAWGQTTLAPTVDGWIRGNNESAKNYDADKLEVANYANESDATKNYQFWGVMQFKITKPEGKQVKTATLRLVTERVKADRAFAIYKLGTTLTGSQTYGNIKSQVDAAMATSPIATFTVKGEYNKALTVGNDIASLAEEYKAIDAWTNTITLNVSSINNATSDDFSFIIVATKASSTAQSTCFFTSERADKLTLNSVDIAAADLQPQLTVEYEDAPDETTEGIIPSVDGWVAKGGGGSYTGEKFTIELKNQQYKKTVDNQEIDCEDLYYGVMHFDLPETPEGKKISKVSLRLVTERIKNDRDVDIYQLGAEVAEGKAYADLESAITTALANENNEKLASFTMVGNGKALLYDEDTNTDISYWTNNIELPVTAVSGSTLNILLSAPTVRNSSNDSNRFFYSGQGDAESTKVSGLTFKSADLVPKLTITYVDIENLAIKDEEKSTDDKDVYTVNGVEEALTVTITKTIDAEGETAAAHGSLEVKAMENAESKIIVTLTPKPDAGHAIDGTPVVEVVSGDSNGDTGTLSLSRALEIGSEVAVTANEDGTYSFEMPANPVKVTAQFKAVVIVVTKPVLTYDEAGNKVSVAFGTVGDEETAATKIYYTTDDTDPKSSETRTELTAGTDIEVTDEMTVIKAVGCDANGNFSDVVKQEVARRSSLKVTKEWVAFYSPNTYTLPEGLKAYTIEKITQPADGQTGTVTLKEQTVINKNTPMLIENTVLDTKTTFVITAADDVTIPEAEMCSEFKGVAEATQLNATNGSVYYVLKDGVFLRVANPGTVSAYNCYIEIPAESAASAARSLSIGGDGTTGIANVKQIVENGDEAWYTLTGVRMAKPTQKGVYIHNGKKIIIK